MADSLEGQKAIRKALRSQISREYTAVQDIFKRVVFSEQDVNDLLAKRRLLLEAKSRLYGVQIATTTMADPTEIGAEMEKDFTYDTKVEAAVTKIDEHLRKSRGTSISSYVASTSLSNAANVDGSASDVGAQSTNSNVTIVSAQPGPTLFKLPTLEIPTFKGDITAWASFWTRFEGAIGKYTNIRDSEKLQMLFSFLKGQPLDLIRDLDINDENYALAIDILSDQYGSIRHLTQKHFEELFRIKPIESPENLAAVRATEVLVSKHAKALLKLDVAETLVYDTIVPLFPYEFVSDFVDVDVVDISVAEVLKFVRKEVNRRERWNRSKAKTSATIRSKSPEAKQKGPKVEPEVISTASMLLATEESKQKPKDSYCVFCDVRTHWGRKCMAKISLKKRHEILKAKNRCLCCMKFGHLTEECDFPFHACERCGGKHFFAVCPRHPYATYGEKKEKVVAAMTSLQLESTSEEETSDDERSVAVNVVSESKRGIVLMQTAEVAVIKGNRKVNILCLLDSDSQRSFLQQEVVDALELKPEGHEDLVIEGFGAKGEDGPFSQYAIKIKSAATSKTTKLNVLAVPQLTNYKSRTMSKEMRLIWDKMQHLGLTPADSRSNQRTRDIRLIIGADFLNQVQLGKMVKVNDDITANETIFGWTVQGRMDILRKAVKKERIAGLFTTTRNLTLQELDNQLQRFWNLDVVGVKEETKPEGVDFDKRFRDNLIYDGERYSARLPWYNEKRELLATNRNQALQRYKSTVRRVLRDPQLLESYDTAMLAYEIDGHSVVTDESRKIEGPVYYLPHQPVINYERSTKVRVVFDASAHDPQQLSLNDCLFGGSDMSIDLVKILLQFRSGAYACTTDLKKAFLQIRLNEEDQNALRYFWVDREKPKEQWASSPRTLQMTRVTFGVVSSPYMLKQTIVEHCGSDNVPADVKPESLKTIIDGTYVDDIVFSRESANSLDEVAGDVAKAMNSAGFEIHEPVRSDRTPVEEKNAVLGLEWLLPADEISVKKPNLCKFSSSSITKRQLVSAASSTFDPLGLLMPVTIAARILIQDVWRAKIDWDDPLPDQLNADWLSWRSSIEGHNNWKCQRYLTPFNNSSPIFSNQFECHYFSDASAKAYGAVVYIKYLTDENCSQVRLLMSKFRVTPIKVTTIPRLELMATTVASRLAVYLRRQFYAPSASYFWTDSTIALRWIRKEVSKKDTFVYNRVQEINRATAGSSWNHCAGSLNPADLATRPNAVFSEDKQTLWNNGPEWLMAGDCPNQSTGEEEIECEEDDVVYALLTSYTRPESEVGKLINLANFSTLKRLYSVTRAVVMAQYRFAKESLDTIDIHDRVEELWVYFVQAEAFRSEQKLLESGLQQHLPRISSMRNLNPFLDDSKVIRVKSRLQCSSLSYEEKFPIVLPESHPFTKLMIMDVHVRLRHAGVSTTLTLIRQRFWVVNGRRACRKVINSCLQCRKFEGKRLTQPIAPLPQDRADYSPPFTCVGLDFAGPVYTRSDDGRIKVKSYVVLFTCAVTRAVHLEAVSSMSTDHFMMALRRFINRRGAPQVIYSDNAAQFKVAAAQLANFDRHTTTDNFQNPHGPSTIVWKWIAERAPWWGGFWERLVRSIKAPLRKSLGRAILTHEEFETVLTEIEAIVNSRPITVCTDDIDDGQAITPAHLLYGRPLLLIRPSSVKDISSTDTTKRFRAREALMKRVAELWKKDYLLQLRSLHVNEPYSPSNVRTGQVVLLLENNEPRHKWKLCRIESTILGRDGRVRSCWLKTATGSSLRRPVQSLVLLEDGPNVDGPGTVAIDPIGNEENGK